MTFTNVNELKVDVDYSLTTVTTRKHIEVLNNYLQIVWGAIMIIEMEFLRQNELYAI